MAINHGDYVKLANAEGGDVGVAWEINPQNTASIQVYWWNDGHRWSKFYEPQNLTLVPPAEIPDTLSNLGTVWGFKRQPILGVPSLAREWPIFALSAKVGLFP